MRLLIETSNPHPRERADPARETAARAEREGEAEDPAEVEAAWAEEIRLRVEEIRNGTAELYDLEDVLAEMEERYG